MVSVIKRRAVLLPGESFAPRPIRWHGPTPTLPQLTPTAELTPAPNREPLRLPPAVA